MNDTFIFFPEAKSCIHSPTDMHFHIVFGEGSSRPHSIGRRLVITVVKTRGAFHSSKTSVLNFPQLPVAKRTAFSKISEKEDNLMQKLFSWKFSFHSTLLPEFLEVLVELFTFQKFNSFCNFWKFSVPFVAVSKFLKKFWLNGKHQKC